MERAPNHLKFEPEPALREGQFIATPVLHSGQILRTLAILGIAGAVAFAMMANRARAAVLAGTEARAAEQDDPVSKPAGVVLARASVKGGQSKTDAAFDAYITRLWPEARAAGVSRVVFDRAFKGVRLNRSVLRPARRQSEFVKPIWSYLSGSVSPKRIADGRNHARRWQDTLSRIEARYGVDRHVILAIWGMETSYGGFTGNQNVIRSLASLAFVGHRESFFRRELLTALVILQQGHVSSAAMTGSWAGAMGQTQFMPTSFVKYAVDHDGDGRKDIWRNVPDALASTANYLASFGWQRGVEWGYEVVIPRDFNFAANDPQHFKPFSYWQSIGVRRANGRAMPSRGTAAIMFPAGRNGPAFLMTKNFDVIKEYNRSNAYALGVGHLSDRIAGAGALRASWPTKERPLTTNQVMAMQRYLNRNGFNAGKVDGKIGHNVTAAVRAYQIKRGLIADGYPSRALLQTMK